MEYRDPNVSGAIGDRVARVDDGGQPVGVDDEQVTWMEHVVPGLLPEQGR